MKNKIILPTIILLFGLFISIHKTEAQADTTNKITGVPKLTYGFKLNLINLVYNPFSQTTAFYSLLYPDNAFQISYPSPAILVKDIKGNTHELEISKFVLDRIDKDFYYQDFALTYQYDANLSKINDLKLMPMVAPYLMLGFTGRGGSIDSTGRYYSNELYAKLGIGLGARYNINKKTFIDFIPSLKLTHFYWLSGRSVSNPLPITYSNNQLLKFEFKDVFFKVGLGHWF